MVNEAILDKCLNEIPDSFELVGQRWDVLLKDNLVLDGEIQLGLSEHHLNDTKIQLALKLGDEPVSKAAIINAYYHELVHVLLNMACMDDDEIKVQSLANLITQYMFTKSYIQDKTEEISKSLENV